MSALQKQAVQAMAWNLDAGPGHIYFVQLGTDGPIKIGITSNVTSRLKSLQSANPYPLRVVLSFCGGEVLEHALHRRFSQYCIRGEWFTPAAELLTFMAEFAVAYESLSVRPAA